MNTRHHAGQGGFTYFMLLWWVALSGIMLAALSQQWAFERRREKEAEMVARAQEITSAIAAYRQAVPTGAWPHSLQDLVEDRRGPRTLRHLRRIWVDPLTGRADWGLVRHSPPPGNGGAAPAEGGIQGVYSRAPGTPIRAPAGTKTYDEWRFEAPVATNGP
jgi:type II secretory pathway pseudopilin PulG